MRSLDEAFRNVPRAPFLPESVRGDSSLDIPLPIGFGQTNSQPSTVRRMLQWLSPQPGDTVMDIGSGSGWTTALLAWLVAPTGKVYAVERIPELLIFAKHNCQSVGFANLQFEPASKTFGSPEHAPYDRILVSASARYVPHELLDQLAPEGKMVIPVRDSIWVMRKRFDGKITTIKHEGYVFVPLLAADT